MFAIGMQLDQIVVSRAQSHDLGHRFGIDGSAMTHDGDIVIKLRGGHCKLRGHPRVKARFACEFERDR
jgi:hypothetical protein